MPAGPRRTDYIQGRASPWMRALHPASVGTMTGAVLAASARSSAPGGRLVPVSIPAKLYWMVVGFALGWGVTKSLDWLRWKCLKGLLSYHGWIYNQKSKKTKLWALCLKALKGPGPYSTLQFQHVLPSQPLPDLDDTLDRWIVVSKQLLSPEEHEQAVQTIEQFRQNEGPKLQAYLKKRFQTKVNWLSDYWLTAAYLSSRDPNAGKQGAYVVMNFDNIGSVHSNFYFSNSIPKSRTADPLARAASIIHHTAIYHERIADQTLPPVQLMDLVPLCMYNYKFLFGSTRLPGEHMDTLACHPGSKHIVVLRKGHFFKLDLYPPTKNGRSRVLTPEEVHLQLGDICKQADAIAEKPLPVAAMTSQRRDAWHKNREHLALGNKDTLHLIDSALFLVSLDEHHPADANELCKYLLTGSGGDRWFDKSFTFIIFEDCSQGANVEHSVIDATVMSSLAEYMIVAEEYENGTIPKDPNTPPRTMDSPERLMWNLEGLEDSIAAAMVHLKELSDDLDLHVHNTRYGKEYMKKKRLSPDGYIQMALQLAYHRLHEENVKTYEPSTGRLFNLGRTETVHPSSQFSVDWVAAMNDEKVPQKECEMLLRKAIQHQTAFRLDATAGHGCDRHLLGMYCASRELGMDVPTIFRDKAFQLPFKMSTSQTPTRIWETGIDVEFLSCGGGFGAVCKDGYGVCYIHLGDDLVNIHITSWKSCSETSSKKFSDALHEAMDDMKKLLG